LTQRRLASQQTLLFVQMLSISNVVALRSRTTFFLNYKHIFILRYAVAHKLYEVSRKCMHKVASSGEMTFEKNGIHK